MRRGGGNMNFGERDRRQQQPPFGSEGGFMKPSGDRFGDRFGNNFRGGAGHMRRGGMPPSSALGGHQSAVGNGGDRTHYMNRDRGGGGDDREGSGPQSSYMQNSRYQRAFGGDRNGFRSMRDGAPMIGGRGEIDSTMRRGFGGEGDRRFENPRNFNNNNSRERLTNR